MRKSGDSLATAFRNVDRDSDIGKLAACLQCMDDLSSFRAYKARSFEMLRLKPGDVAVDLGCGLGFDAQKLADAVSPGGLAIGIDNSGKLLEAAKRAHCEKAGLEFRQCDMHQLRLESGCVDAIRVDRALQHVENPQTVISEMARVLKPGGWLVCAEPDWFTFVIDFDEVEITEMVSEKWRSGFRNPRIGRQLLGRIRNAGLQHAQVEGFILLADGLERMDSVYDVLETARILGQENDALSKRLNNWRNELIACDKTMGVTASVTLFLACGQKQ